MTEPLPVENSADDGFRGGGEANLLAFPLAPRKTVAFDRREMTLLLDLYGRYVATGDWRDYALDFTRELAIFSIFRRASEQPLYRIIKDPSQSRRQQQFAVVAQGGHILKRGNDLGTVLRILLKRPHLART
jgi:Protein of unknown function (DUF2794)